MKQRPSWEKYFMTIAMQVAERSTCLRAKVGAVIVRDRNILASGYNGSPAGTPHCLDVGCLMHDTITPGGATVENCFRTVHAEVNAIAQAAKNGSRINASSIYVTHSPCFHCLKVIINAGIPHVYYEKPYRLEMLHELIMDSDIEMRRIR